MLKKSDLKPRQSAAVTAIFEQDHNILIAPTGAGKTIICLTAIQELIAEGVGPFIVGCPAKVVPVWAKEAVKWEHTKGLRIVELTSDPDSRYQKLYNPDVDVFVVSLNNLAWLLDEKHGCQGIIIDELSKAAGKQTAALKTKKCDMLEWRVGMTATPVAENFKKLFKMVRIVDGGRSLGRNAQKFEDTYGYTDYMGYNWTLHQGADKLILDKIKHLIHAVEDTKVDDLPTLHEHEILFDMPEATQEIYAEMKKHFLVGDVEAANEAVKSSKLRQIASGFLYGEGDACLSVFDRARQLHMVQWLDQLGVGRKAVIFYEYKQQLGAINDELKRDGRNFAIIAGGMSKATVANQMNYFCNLEADILVAQINSLSHGVDGLQDVCSDMLFYHPMWSRDATEQAIGRLWRTGQQNEVNVTTLVCKQSLDPLVTQRVTDKGIWMQKFKQHLEG